MESLLFLYGELRSFETAIKTWNILNMPELDIIVHTPNTTTPKFSNITYVNVTEQDFAKLPNSKIYLHDREDYKISDSHVLHYSYRFLSNYLKTSKKYKYIFIGRVDSTFYIHDLDNFLKTCDDELYVQQLPNTENSFMPDHVFFGKYDVVKKFVDKLPPSEQLEYSHSDMGRYLIREKFNLKQWPTFESRHIRDNMEDIFNNYFKNRQSIQKIDDEYLNFYRNNNKLFIKLDNEYKRSK